VSSFEKTRLVRYLAATQPRSDGGPRTDLTNRPESSESQHGQPACPEVVAELMEMAHHENLDRFEQLFRSVQREPREKRMGAKAYSPVTLIREVILEGCEVRVRRA